MLYLENGFGRIDTLKGVSSDLLHPARHPDVLHGTVTDKGDGF
jgi:hypothetical protein